MKQEKRDFRWLKLAILAIDKDLAFELSEIACVVILVGKICEIIGTTPISTTTNDDNTKKINRPLVHFQVLIQRVSKVLNSIDSFEG